MGYREAGADGATVAALPATDADDAKRWKELKRLCGTVARGQFARLELSMAEAHRMPFGHFAEIYLMHSLIRNLSGSLLWAAYRDDARLFAFAVEDGGGVGVHGKPIELPVDARYGVVHPAELADKEREAWTKRFAVQPFEQLARAVFAASTAADCQKKLAKYVGRTVPTAGLLGLQRRGWSRGDSPQGGDYHTIQRAGRGWSAELAFMPGIHLGQPTEEQNQVLEAVVFRAETPPPIAILSDIQRDLAKLVAG